MKWYFSTQNRPYSGFTGIGEKHKNVVRKGTEHHSAKLNPDKVRAIRARLAAGEARAKLATEYEVSTTTIGDIANKTIWRSVLD